MKRPSAAGLVALAFGVLVAPAAAAPALHVIPFPGTPDANAFSRVIFSSLRPSNLHAVVVTGSRSGTHTGRLTLLPDDAGTAFVPAKPFTAGEQVRVRAMLNSAAAGTASGDPGSKLLRFSFQVAVTARAPGAGSAHDGSGLAGVADESPRSQLPTQSFHSAPGLHPPLVRMSPDSDTASGDIFLTPTETKQTGPMILNSRGQLVWFDPIPGPYTANLQVQRYQHQPVLTWSQETRATSRPWISRDVIMSPSYRIVRILHAGDGYAITGVHEFILTSQGTAFIDVSAPVKTNLASVGGPAEGSVRDSVIQELDVKTGQVLWEWHALGHVPVSDSYSGRPPSWPPYDAFHLNSIQALPNGNLLISLRNTWGVYEIDRQTGKVIWSLGGRHSSFKMGSRANFEWQHDAHLVGHTLTLFDDAAFPQEERVSSAKVLRLNPARMAASLVARYQASPPLLTGAAGSTQSLANGNVFVGWGRQPDFSEYTAAGRRVFTASMPGAVWSYRAYRFPWHAQPLTRPSLALSSAPDGGLTVYASWNGATQVAAWRVLGGSRPGALRALTQAPRSGFETAVGLATRPRYVAAQALSADGKLLGTSGVHSG